MAHSSVKKDKNADMSVGDVIRKAKKDLFFKRCLYGIMLVLIVTLIAAAFILGYADSLIERFFSLMG